MVIAIKRMGNTSIVMQFVRAKISFTQFYVYGDEEKRYFNMKEKSYKTCNK